MDAMLFLWRFSYSIQSTRENSRFRPNEGKAMSAADIKEVDRLSPDQRR